MQGDDGSSRVSQVATSAGPLGSKIDTGNQGVQLRQRCGVVDGREEGSSDQKNKNEPNAATDQEQQVLEKMQHMRTSIAATAPHARCIHIAIHLDFIALLLLYKFSVCEMISGCKAAMQIAPNVRISTLLSLASFLLCAEVLKRMHACECKSHWRPAPSRIAALVKQGSALMVSCLRLVCTHCWAGHG